MTEAGEADFGSSLTEKLMLTGVQVIEIMFFQKIFMLPP